MKNKNLILTILIFLLFFSISCINIKEKNFNFNGFNYIILDFGKNQEGKKVIFYLTRMFFPERKINYSLYLRYNPKKNNVKIEIENLKEIKKTYIAIDKEFDNKNCSELTLAGYKLGEFLYVLGVEKEVAIFDKNSNETHKGSYIIIKNYNFSEENNVTLIILKYGKEEKVYNIKNTIIIQSNNCNILRPTEKFILFIIEKLKKLDLVIPL